MEGVTGGSRSYSRKAFRRRAVATAVFGRALLVLSKRQVRREEALGNRAQEPSDTERRAEEAAQRSATAGRYGVLRRPGSHRADAARIEPARVATAAKRGLWASWSHV